jgi:hypothetical protein
MGGKDLWIDILPEKFCMALMLPAVFRLSLSPLRVYGEEKHLQITVFMPDRL